jgi:hypothetical protein
MHQMRRNLKGCLPYLQACKASLCTRPEHATCGM